MRGEKWEEYRSRATTHRGDLLICAGKLWSPHEDKPDDWCDYPRGVAVCIVEVTDCYYTAGGVWAYVLGSVRTVDPFPARGKLGFWEQTIPANIKVGPRRMNPDPSRKDESEPPAAGDARGKRLPGGLVEYTF